jgi:hypothetical protein
VRLEDGPHRIEIAFSCWTDLDIFHCVTCWDVSKAQDFTEGFGCTAAKSVTGRRKFPLN